MEHLPDECLAKILEGVSRDDTALVSKSWYKLVNRSRFVVHDNGGLFLWDATFGSTMNRSGFRTKCSYDEGYEFVAGCGGGLVCTREKSTLLRLTNPITGLQFALPVLEHEVSAICLAIFTETKPPVFRLLYLIWRESTRTLECLVYDSAAATAAWSTICEVPFDLKHMKQRLLYLEYDVAACFSSCHKAFYFITATHNSSYALHLWSFDTRDEVSTVRLRRVATWTAIENLHRCLPMLASSGSRLVLAEVDQATYPGKSTVVRLKELDIHKAAWRLLSCKHMLLPWREEIMYVGMAASETQVVLTWWNETSDHETSGLLVYHIPSGSWSRVDIGVFGWPVPFYMQLAEGDPLRQVGKPSTKSGVAGEHLIQQTSI